MKAENKAFLNCLYGAGAAWCGVMMYHEMPDYFGWMLVETYGVLTWVNSFCTLLDLRKSRKLLRMATETEAGRMTREWPWSRVLWHRLKGHEITLNGQNYPPPVCRTCELARLCDHGAAMTFRDEQGKAVSLYCSKCDTHIAAGKSSDRKMEV